MTAQEARELINTAGREHTMLAYFVKRDGTMRRMLFIYDGRPSPKPHLMLVRDLEKGADRHVNLETLASLRVLRSRVKRQDREPKPRAYIEERREQEKLARGGQLRSYAEVKAEIDKLFY